MDGASRLRHGHRIRTRPLLSLESWLDRDRWRRSWGLAWPGESGPRWNEKGIHWENNSRESGPLLSEEGIDTHLRTHTHTHTRVPQPCQPRRLGQGTPIKMSNPVPGWFHSITPLLTRTEGHSSEKGFTPGLADSREAEPGTSCSASKQGRAQGGRGHSNRQTGRLDWGPSAYQVKHCGNGLKST